ncbi:MAG TPA: A24 family peptidase [Pseudolabrys sp.]|nr:A24 family peptidase [Pseudolabrys sp.]
MKQMHLADVAVGAAGLAAAAASVWAAPGIGGALGAVLALLMLAIAVIDYRSFIIPDELTAAALALALVYVAVTTAAPIVDSVAAAALRGVLCMLFFLGLRVLYRRLRGREGLGLGDVKLAFVAGAWLDWTMIPVAIEIAALAALGAYGTWRFFGGRSVTATSRLPFGLFFAPAIWLAWLAGALLFGA